MTYSSVTVTSKTAVQIVSQNTDRKSIIITNEGDYKVYIGYDSSITTASTISIDAGGKFIEDDSGGHRVYLGDIYGISEDSSNDVRYWER